MFKAATLARTCLAGLALVVLSASLAKAIYGPRTTIGKNYQQFSLPKHNSGSRMSGPCSAIRRALLSNPSRPHLSHLMCTVARG